MEEISPTISPGPRKPRSCASPTHSPRTAAGGGWAGGVSRLHAAGFGVQRGAMRGRGGGAPVAGDWTVPALDGDVAGVLDALSVGRVHYVGLAVGGMIGQAFALAHGDRLL